jgi:uncharacterized protein YndB with AHSA1/START domain
MNTERTKVTIETTVQAPMEKVWDAWTQPKHVTRWNAASDDWHCPHGENDLRVGGAFTYRMEAKDGSSGFDFGGTYDEVVLHEKIAYTMSDGRKVETWFAKEGDGVKVTETFDAESENPVEMQKSGWQAILDRFKKYVEET